MSGSILRLTTLGHSTATLIKRSILRPLLLQRQFQHLRPPQPPLPTPTATATATPTPTPTVTPSPTPTAAPTPTPTPLPTAATPIFYPNGGTYRKEVDVHLFCDTSGATMYYTTDGSTPTTSSS